MILDKIERAKTHELMIVFMIAKYMIYEERTRTDLKKYDIKLLTKEELYERTHKELLKRFSDELYKDKIDGDVKVELEYASEFKEFLHSFYLTDIKGYTGPGDCHDEFGFRCTPEDRKDINDEWLKKENQ